MQSLLRRAREFLSVTAITARHDVSGEPAQAIFRSALALVGLIYAIAVLASGDGAPVHAPIHAGSQYGWTTHPVLLALYAYALIGAGLLLHCWRRPGYLPWRRVISYVADYGLITFVLSVGGTGFAPFFIFLLWVTVGNGIRCGQRELQVSTGLAMVSLVLVAALDDDWLSRPYFYMTVVGMVVLMPAYFWSLYRMLVRTSHAATQADQAKGRFLANMSHEFRTPLHSIQSMADLISGCEISHEARDYANAIRSSARSLGDLVQDLLDFSAIEAGRLPRRVRPFRSKDVLDHVTATIAPIASEKQLSVDVRIGDGIPDVVVGCGDHARRALLNLASNAVKFTEHGGVWISMSIDRVASPRLWLRFEVGDSGPGVVPEVRARLFEPFVMEDDASTRKLQGTGLGTAIAKQLVESNGGTIGFSTGTTGSTFWFTFEVAEAQDETVPSAIGAEAVHAPASHGRSLEVLVVDDHPPNRMVAQAMLRRAGHRPVCAESGAAAVDYLLSHSPDVILMDLHMPGQDGLYVTRWLRMRETNAGKPSVPVLLLTADSSPKVRDLALEAGVTAVLHKPMGMDDLIRHVGNVGHALPRPEAPIEHATREFDAHLRELREIMGQDKLFYEYLEQSIADGSKCLAALQSAFESALAEEASDAAHGLKGICANLGLASVASRCGELEDWLDTHRVVPDDAGKRYLVLARAFESGVDDVREAFSLDQSAHQGSHSPLSS